MLRLLVTIPHYYLENGNSHYGATGRASKKERVAVIRRQIIGLHSLFTEKVGLLNGTEKKIHLADKSLRIKLDIVFCTTGNSHLIDEVSDLSSLFTHRACTEKPSLLGYQCHQVLKENLGDYDYYGYIEDDLLISDPYFFIKLRWFNKLVGNDFVLQPNRYEISVSSFLSRLYIDGNLHRQEMGNEFQKKSSTRIFADFLGESIEFQAVNNPHSGCFFLNQPQMEFLVTRLPFPDFDTRFAGPLESAASLGIMKAFTIYKAACENAAFLSIEHLSHRYLTRDGIAHWKLAGFDTGPAIPTSTYMPGC